MKRWALAFLFTCPCARAALPDDARAALDAVLARAPVVNAGAQTGGPILALETTLKPLVAANHADYAAWLKFDAFLEQRLKDIRANFKYSPYDDNAWRIQVHGDLKELCCLLRTSPPLAEAVRQRAALGKRPLPNGFQNNKDLKALLNSKNAN